MSRELVRKLGNVVSVKIFDRMLDRQTRALGQMLQESIVAAGGKIRLLLTIDTRLPARSPEALFENLQFARLYADHIDRLAIIGSQAWQRTSVGLFGLFGGIETAYFDRSQTAEAIKWLQEG